MSKERKEKRRKSRASSDTTEDVTKEGVGVLHKEKCTGR